MDRGTRSIAWNQTLGLLSMKIAITGHTAGIGQAFANILQGRGHDIVGLSKRHGNHASLSDVICQDRVINRDVRISIDVIFNVGEIYHFENSTGEQFSGMVESMSSNVLENIKTAVSRNMGVTYGA